MKEIEDYYFEHLAKEVEYEYISERQECDRLIKVLSKDKKLAKNYMKLVAIVDDNEIPTIEQGKLAKDYVVRIDPETSCPFFIKNATFYHKTLDNKITYDQSEWLLNNCSIYQVKLIFQKISKQTKQQDFIKDAQFILDKSEDLTKQDYISVSFKVLYCLTSKISEDVFNSYSDYDWQKLTSDLLKVKENYYSLEMLAKYLDSKKFVNEEEFHTIVRLFVRNKSQFVSPASKMDIVFKMLLDSVGSEEKAVEVALGVFRQEEKTSLKFWKNFAENYDDVKNLPVSWIRKLY